MFQDLLSRIKGIEDQISRPKENSVKIENIKMETDEMLKQFIDYYNNSIIENKQTIFQKEHETRKITNDPKIQTTNYERNLKHFENKRQSIMLSYKSIDTENPTRPTGQDNKVKYRNNQKRKFQPKKRKVCYDNTPPRPIEEKVIEHIIELNAKDSKKTGVVTKTVSGFSTASALHKIEEKKPAEVSETKPLIQSISRSNSGVFNSPSKALSAHSSISQKPLETKDLGQQDSEKKPKTGQMAPIAPFKAGSIAQIKTNKPIINLSKITGGINKTV